MDGLFGVEWWRNGVLATLRTPHCGSCVLNIRVDLILGVVTQPCDLTLWIAALGRLRMKGPSGSYPGDLVAGECPPSACNHIVTTVGYGSELIFIREIGDQQKVFPFVGIVAATHQGSKWILSGGWKYRGISGTYRELYGYSCSLN